MMRVLTLLEKVPKCSSVVLCLDSYDLTSYIILEPQPRELGVIASGAIFLAAVTYIGTAISVLYLVVTVITCSLLPLTMLTFKVLCAL